MRRAAVKGQAVVNDLNMIVSIINESHPTGRQLDEDNAQFAKNIEAFNSISTGLAGATDGQTTAAALSSLLRIPGVLVRLPGETCGSRLISQLQNRRQSALLGSPASRNLIDFAGDSSDIVTPDHLALAQVVG
jgi:hypothetical protein